MESLPKHFIEQAEVPRHIRIRSWEELQQESKAKKLILFGAGEGCRKFIKGYANDYGLSPTYVVDNAESKWNTVTATGLTIQPPAALAEEQPDNVVVVITSVYIKSISAQLLDMGVQNIFSFLYLRNIYRILQPEETMEIEKLSSLLSDERSREVLYRIVEKRNENAWDYRDCCEAGQYFTKDIMHPDKDEVFVDAGAYDGDTIEGFLQWCGNCFRSIYAYEPDRKNFKELQNKFSTNEKIHCIEAGLWNENKTLSFADGNTSGSQVIETGSTCIKATIPQISEKVTTIKMDIEGAEMMALEGCRNIIKRDHPKLAICIYHRRNDLWEIPFKIQEMYPGYRFYMRHHDISWPETVLYALPE